MAIRPAWSSSDALSETVGPSDDAMAKIRPRIRNVTSPHVSTSSASGIRRHRLRNFSNVIASNVAAVISIPELDAAVMRAARQRQSRLTKPAGSLGRLEELSIRIAGMTGQLDPPLEH